MKISKLVPDDLITIGWPSGDIPAKPDKWKLIEKLNSFIFQNTSYGNTKQSEALECLLDREKSMTTGIGHGVAIPHASVPFIKKALGTICVLPGGIDFESIDHKPTNIIFLALLPGKDFDKHIQTLANIANITNEKSFRDTIIKMKNPSDIWNEISKLEDSAKR